MLTTKSFQPGGQCYDFKNVVSKKIENILYILTKRTTASMPKIDHNIVFHNNRHYLAENGQIAEINDPCNRDHKSNVCTQVPSHSPQA
jgi:hypothetical protein